MKTSKDILIRAVKTFYQTAVAALLGYFAAGVDITDKKVIFGVLISSIAAGLSAVNNLAINAWNKKGGK